MKRFAMILLGAAVLVGAIGIAGAQVQRGSPGVSGAGAHSSGNWRGGGNWQGGSWRGGGNWQGGGWRGGHSRVFVGVGFGAPWWGWGWWPGYYAYPAYYPAYPYYADYPYTYDYTAPTYIQQDVPAYPQNAPAPSYTERRFGQSEEYDYYCPDPAGYYPQVSTCAKGWLRVLPPGAPGPAAPVQR